MTADGPPVEGMQSVLERGRDAEVAAPAADGPEQSGFSVALVSSSCPSAVTMSTEVSWSQDRPKRRATRPNPPPKVKPPAPVCDTVPVVVTRPNGSVSRSRSPRSAPPPTRASRSVGSTRTPRIKDRSIMSPSSHTDWPERLWPPPRTATSNPYACAKLTARTTSAAPRHRAIIAGWRSNMPLKILRASSYPAAPGNSNWPRKPARKSSTSAARNWIFLPSPVTAVISAVTVETAVNARPNGNAAAPIAAAAERQKDLLFMGRPPTALLCAGQGAAGKQSRDSRLAL